MLMYIEIADCWGRPPSFEPPVILCKHASIQIADEGVGYCPYRRSLDSNDTVLTHIGPIKTKRVSLGLVIFRVALVYSESPPLKSYKCIQI
jgi:hypothetical protein